MLKLHPVSVRGRFFAKPSVLLLFLSLGVLGCAGSNYVTVRVPPEVDLRSYAAVGIIELGSNADAAISRYATERFQSSVQSAQPGTRLVELGTAESVLAAVGARQLDADAIKKIGTRFGVAAVFEGNIKIAGTVRSSNPREEMVPGLIREVLTGLRESTVRRRID